MDKYLRFAAIFILAALTGCSSIYMPSVPNTPMLTTQGELAAGAHVSLKGGFNFNAAYALGNHFAFMANGAYLKNETTKKDTKNKSSELGAGYFNTFGPDNNRIIEVYAGVGSGKSERLVRSFDHDNVIIGNDFQEAKYDKKSIQVNYSAKKKDNVNLFGVNFGLNFGTALRLSFVKTNDFYRNQLLQPNEDNIFLEPVFFTRMILSDQVQLQYTSGSNIGLKSRKFLNAGYSVFTIGAVVNLGRQAKKQ